MSWNFLSAPSVQTHPWWNAFPSGPHIRGRRRPDLSDLMGWVSELQSKDFLQDALGSGEKAQVNCFIWQRPNGAAAGNALGPPTSPRTLPMPGSLQAATVSLNVSGSSSPLYLGPPTQPPLPILQVSA